MAKVLPFDKLANPDLTVDGVYAGGTAGNTGDDPLGKLGPVGNRAASATPGRRNTTICGLLLFSTPAADRTGRMRWTARPASASLGRQGAREELDIDGVRVARVEVEGLAWQGGKRCGIDDRT